MKRMGILGGMSAQATMDVEDRVHRCAQHLLPQDWNRGYPPMVVWCHRRSIARSTSVTGEESAFVSVANLPPLSSGAAIRRYSSVSSITAA